MMKVLIVGSLAHLSPDSESATDFIKACMEIGNALARKGMEILVGSSGIDTADFHVVAGASQVSGMHRISVLRPAFGDTPEFKKDGVDLPNLDISIKRAGGNWSSGRIPQILAADVVLLIGGRGGVKTTGYVAQALEKPVLALRSFDGAAEEIWKSINTKYEQIFSDNEIYNIINEGWKIGNGDKVVEFLTILYKIQPFRTKKRMPFALYNISLVIFLATWVSVFVHVGNSKDNQFISSMFFFIVFISGVLGIMLRNNLRLLFDKSAKFSWNDLWIELGTGLLLGFAMTLLYLTGSLALSPNQEEGIIPRNPDAFQRVSLIMTLLGLGCGLKIESAAEKLRSWFSNQVT